MNRCAQGELYPRLLQLVPPMARASELSAPTDQLRDNKRVPFTDAAKVLAARPGAARPGSCRSGRDQCKIRIFSNIEIEYRSSYLLVKEVLFYRTQRVRGQVR